MRLLTSYWMLTSLLTALLPALASAVKTLDGTDKPHLQQHDVDCEINCLYEALMVSKEYADEHGWDIAHDTAQSAQTAVRRVFSMLGALDCYHFTADPPLRAADVPGHPEHAGADGMYEVHGDPPFYGYLHRNGEFECRPIELVLAYGHAGLVHKMLDDFELSSGRCAGQEATWAPCGTRAWYTPSKCAASLIERGGGKSLLVMVVEFGRADLVPILLSHCSDDTWFDPNQCGSKIYETPLHCAVARNDPNAIRALLKDPRVYPNCICMYTPLHNAIMCDRERAAEALLDDERVDILRGLNGHGPIFQSPIVQLAKRRLAERSE